MKELAETPRPARRLTDNAIEVGPHNRGGVWIVPAVDAEASMEREDELRDRIEELDDELENVAIGLFLMDRMASSSGKTMSADEFIARAEKLAADSVVIVLAPGARSDLDAYRKAATRLGSERRRERGRPRRGVN